jgi:hypothetical protein
MVEAILSIFCILLIFYLGWVGVSFGLFFEMTSALLFFLAMMVTLRYWYLATQLIISLGGFSGAYAAFWAFLILFILGSVPLLIVMKFVNEDSRPKYPNLLDVSLGFAFGTVSSAIVICGVLTLASIIVPKAWEPYEPSAILLRLDKMPISLFRFVEETFFGIGEKDPRHTRLPTLEKDEADNFDAFWR